MTRQTAGRSERHDGRPDQAAWQIAEPILSGTCLALAEVEPDGWSVLHDLHRPGSAWADIERIVVGPGGILVMQTLPGHGEVTVADGTLRVRGYARTPDVTALADAAGAVTALLAPEHRRLVRTVLVLSDQRLAPTPVRGGAMAVGERQLADHVRSMPAVLPLAELPLVVDYLTAELGDDTSPEQLTVDDVLYGSPAPMVPTEARASAAASAALVPGVDWVLEDEPAPAPAPAPRPSRSDRLLRWGTAGLVLATVVNVVLALLGA
jgi:hypothetical protein